MKTILPIEGTPYGLDVGLSEELCERGRNTLTPPAKTPWWAALLGMFRDTTIIVLLVSAFVSLAVTAVERWCLHDTGASFVDSIGIFLAIGLATVVGFLSERKSAHEFELLNQVKEDIAIKTIRSGQVTTVPIADLVVGDIVVLEPGDRLAADGVLLETAGLSVDESMLTGESLPAFKKAYKNAPNQDPDRFDLKELIAKARLGEAYFAARGTMVTDGRGLMVVTAVGDETQMGQIAGALAAQSDSDEETPLVGKLTVLARQISVGGMTAAVGIFTVMAVIDAWQSPLRDALMSHTGEPAALLGVSLAAGWLLERFALKPFLKSMDMELRSPWLALLAWLAMVVAAFTIVLGLWGLTRQANLPDGVDLLKDVLLAFVVAVTIIVVAVPEGLPMMVTISLAMNMMKMARENCLVRRLVASETIGSATVICTDKTGTLTENKMVPRRIFADGRDYAADDFGKTIKAFFGAGDWARQIAVNSQADLHIEEKDGGTVVTGIGNPTECSLLKFLHRHGGDYRQERASGKILFELGHNSQRKMSLVEFQDHEGRRFCFAKGAPRRILDACSSIVIDGRVEPIALYRREIDRALAEYAKQSLRVLAFCSKNGPLADAERQTDSPRWKAGGYTLTCLIGIADPLRPEIPDAVKRCREAHIQVKMITGDALPTAEAIAREAGILTGAPNELVLTSDQLAEYSDDKLSEAAGDIRVLARSTPMDKLRLVQALHRKGEVVAMTGDGTNDAPALKAADVGLSMGISGTEVAKEASDIVLVDDNFKSIVTGVWWGRTLYQNIQRFLQFQLSVNVVALIAALVGPLVHIPLPLTVTQLRWINIIMDTFAALALSTDPPRPRTMTEKPIARDAHIITGTMIFGILFNGLYQVAILFLALFGGWFLAPEEKYNGAIAASSPEYLEHNLPALTVFFTIFVMFQFWHKFNCRALRHGDRPFELLRKN
ncbi:MAG: cation-translocating P-type ATPase, partial [Thermoguttaceae bacterium]|nr:cation-translocating P-type ATPase [Thermoguttaceae bacterium]